MNQTFRYAWTALASLGLSSTLATAQDLQAMLKHEIVGTNLPLAEVQNYTESQVPVMPRVKSVRDWEKYATRTRQATLEQVIFRGEAKGWRDARTQVDWQETIEGGPGYHIRKLRYEVLPGLWVPALLYEPDKLTGKTPVHLAVNGHDANGKQAPYKQIRCINLAKRGIISLNVEWFGMGQLRTDGFVHYRMNQLDLCGSSGIAPFYLAMTRGIDILLAHKNADAERLAVSGLSGGGWQTIFISSLDTRVKLTNPVAGYSSFRTRARYLSDLGDSEQTPSDLATTTDYAIMTAMMAPRATLLTFNAKDNCCFASDHSLEPLVEAANPVFGVYGQPFRLRTHINYDPGTHNYEKDNREAFYGMIRDFFYKGVTNFNPQEIACENEVKSKEQLNVDLPADNLDFSKLAAAISQKLPRNAEIPTDKGDLKKWRRNGRDKLREVVHAKEYKVSAQRMGRQEADDIKATYWRLKMGEDWTVPVVDLSRGEPKKTVILVADAGRTSVVAQAEKLLAAGNRVLAVDPFYFGESHIKSRDFLYAILVAAVGDRPLGIQASQLAAVARWSDKEHGNGPVTIIAEGPRTCTIALVAAGIEEKAIGGVELKGAMGSLKELLGQGGSVDKTPELFCFGLLEQFDIPQLKALVGPRPVVSQ